MAPISTADISPPIGTDGEVPAVNSNGTNGAVTIDALKAAVKTAINSNSSDAFSLSEQFAYTPRKLRVITIGAGFSGLVLAQKFQHRFPEMQDIVDHTMYEG